MSGFYSQNPLVEDENMERKLRVFACMQRKEHKSSEYSRFYPVNIPCDKCSEM